MSEDKTSTYVKEALARQGGPSNTSNDEWAWLGCLIPVLAAAWLVYSCSDKKEGKGRDDAGVAIVAQDQIRSKLRDPSSAQFTNVRTAYQGDVAIGACGYVNSKNGFGGMSGPQRFIAGGAISVIEGDGIMSPSEFEESWAQICQ